MMLRIAAVTLALAVTLSAFGHTPGERVVSGALIGGLVGATVGVIAEPDHGDGRYAYHDRGHRGYGRHRGRGWHGRHHGRRDRDWDYD
jgi:hypothetical protein